MFHATAAQLSAEQLAREFARCSAGDPVAVNVTTAARSRGPNAEPAIPAGNRAVVLVPQHEQRSRCVRCSINSTLIGGSSAS